MARILRGDLLWADLDPVQGREQAGRRPVLVISRELFNEKSETVIAMAVTSKVQRTPFPLTFKLPDGVLPQDSWVKISQVRVLSTARLGRKIGRLDESDVDRIVEGLLDIVGP